MIDLANLVDTLASAGELLVTETAAQVVLVDVRAQDAARILALVLELGWDVRAENGAAEEVAADFDAAFAPFRFTIQKPMVHGRQRLLTLVGFDQWLGGTPSGLVQVARSAAPFETGAFRVGNWSDVAEFEPAQKAKSPRSLVREVSQTRSVPDDIRPWLVSDSISPEWDDVVFCRWRLSSVLPLLRSVAAEVDAGKSVCFAGSARLWMDEPNSVADPSEGRFGILQRLVAWVYESPSETETRFRLLNLEFGRLGRSGRVDVDGVLEYAPVALEGARMAFQYSLAKVSADSVKALADLRKSLSEETARLSDAVRQIVNAVSGAIFIGIGLVAARFVTDTPSVALILMGLVLAGYVGIVIYSGYKYLKIQREMRVVWRERLYGYISQSDYKAMILDNAAKAEDQFFFTSWLGGALTLGIVIMLIVTVALR